MELLACGDGDTSSTSSSCSSPQSYIPDTTSLPILSFYWDLNGDGTAVSMNTTARRNTFYNGLKSSVACGPFGIFESGNGGEYATEIELHRTAAGERIFALTSGIVTELQAATAPTESETEGIWVRYGRNFTLKYTHVCTVQVNIGDQITEGQLLAYTCASGFYEVEAEEKSGSTILARPMRNYLSSSDQSIFDTLLTIGTRCSVLGWTNQDGSTATVANWANTAKTEIDVTAQVRPCSF
jgi:hypothetical protein